MPVRILTKCLDPVDVFPTNPGATNIRRLSSVAPFPSVNEFSKKIQITATIPAKSMSNYSSLSEFLKNAGEDDLTIEKLYETHVGCFAFSPHKLPNHSSKLPISELDQLSDVSPVDPKNDNFGPGVLEELKTALESHPNVFGLKQDNASRLTSTFGYARLITGDVFRFKVNFPARLQRYKGALEKSDETIEQIGVGTNGSLFFCYAERTDFQQTSWFAQEYREFFRELIDKRNKINLIGVPPCPIHPTIWIATYPEGKAPKKIIHKKGTDLIIVVSRKTTIEHLVKLMLESFSSDLEKFFRIAVEGMLISLYETEIFNEFSTLTNSYRSILTESWWRVVQRHKNWVMARASLANIHLRLVEYGSNVAEYERQVKEYPTSIQKNVEIAAWTDYLTKQFRSFSIPQYLISSLQYFERELQLFGHKRVILVASSIAATVSAIISVLIALLRHH